MRDLFANNAFEDMKPILGKPGTIWEAYRNKDSAATVSKDNVERVPFQPVIFVDPAIKQTKEFSLRAVMAMYYNNWGITNNAFGNSERSRFIDNRAWSNGKQDMQSFMGGKKARNNEDKNPIMKHLDFDPVSQQSKYRDIVVGYLEDLDFDIVATSLNPEAQAQRENQYLNEIVNLRNRSFNKAADQKAGQPVSPPSTLKFQVTDEQELDLYFQLGGAKEIFELEIEIGNQVVLNDSDFKEIKKMLLEDAFDCGEMIVDVIYDKDGRIKVKYVDPCNRGREDFRGHYMKRPAKFWYMELKTVQQILMESQGQFDLDDMQRIAQMYENKFGNPTWNQSYSGWQTYVNTDATYALFFMNWQVPVMYARWEDLDVYNIITYSNVNGAEIKTFAPYDKSADAYIRDLSSYGPYAPQLPTLKEDGSTDVGLGGKTNTQQLQYHRQYQCTWIVNTQFVYDYGRVPFQPRDPFNPRLSLSSIKYYRVTQQPLAERIKPYVKKILLTYQKIDNVIARLKPPGWEINVQGLENITLGDGTKFSVKHAFEMWNETGDLLVKRKAGGDILNQTQTDKFVTPLSQADFFNYMQGLIAYKNLCQEEIVNMTGLNEFMDASNPNPQTPVALARSAQQGTKNSLSQITSGLLHLCEKIALDVSDRLGQVIEYSGDYSGYADAIGSGMMRIRKITKAVIGHRYGIKVEAKPSRAEREQFEQAVMQAFSNQASPEQGGLWVTDAMNITEKLKAGVNMKLLRLEMTSIIKNRLAFLQQQKTDMINQQVQGNNQSQAAATDAATKAKQEETRLQMLLISHQADEDIRVNSAVAPVKGSIKMQTDQNKANLKIRDKMFSGGEGGANL